MFKVFRSTNPDSDGGTIGTEFIPRQDKLAVIEPIAPCYPGTPSSCYKGLLYKKIFIANDLIAKNNVKVSITNQPKTGIVYIAPGSVDDTALPQDSEFVQVVNNKGVIDFGNIASGEPLPVWLMIRWPDAAGLTVDSSVTISVDHSTGHEDIELFYFLELYVEKFSKGEDNDYTSWLKDLFITFLRNVFYRTPRKDFQWHPDPNFTNIFIADRLTYNLEEPEKRPSIVVIRGGLGWRDVVMDNLRSYDLVNDVKDRTDLINGSIVMQCVARESLHAESLATTVFKVLQYYKDDIRKLGIHDLRGVSMGEEVTIMGDTRPEAVMVPVNFRIVVQDSWTTWQDWPILRGIDFTVGDQKKMV